MLVYKATNLVTGKIYIGQTTRSLELRKQAHFQAAYKGSNTHFHQSIRKYGPDNFSFEILQEVSTKKELNRLETYYIQKFDSIKQGYNMVDGGHNNIMFNGKVKKKHDAIMRSEEVRNKISNTLKAYRKEHPFTEETRCKISEKLKGNQHGVNQVMTPEHLQALRKSHYKKVHCEDMEGNVLAKFDTVQQAAYWWFQHGYNTVNDWHQLSNMIKQSGKKNKFIRGLKWIYD